MANDGNDDDGDDDDEDDGDEDDKVSDHDGDYYEEVNRKGIYQKIYIP